MHWREARRSPIEAFSGGFCKGLEAAKSIASSNWISDNSTGIVRRDQAGLWLSLQLEGHELRLCVCDRTSTQRRTKNDLGDNIIVNLLTARVQE